jgi:hypothetical protein
MDHDGFIEPLGDQDISSDYDPSIDASELCSITSSINNHVWEYGR